MSRRKPMSPLLAVVLGNTALGRGASRALDRLGRWALLLLAGLALWCWLHPLLALVLGAALVAAGTAPRWLPRPGVGLPDGRGDDPRREVAWPEDRRPAGWYEWYAPEDPQLLERCREITGDQWWPGEKLYAGKANDLVRRWGDHRSDGRVFVLPGVTVIGHVVASEAEALRIEAEILRSAPGRYNIAGVH